MRRQVERMRQEEERQAQLKHERNQKMLREVEAANKISMQLKEKERQDQIKADEEIFRYV